MLNKPMKKGRLQKLLKARQQSPEAFRKAFNEEFPVQADKPEMWHEGDPMPDWAKQEPDSPNLPGPQPTTPSSSKT